MNQPPRPIPGQPATRLAISAGTQVLQMQVQGMVGLQGPKITLADVSGQWTVAVPRDAFSAIHALPGEILIVTVGLTRVAIEAGDTPPPSDITHFTPFTEQ